MSTPAYIVDNKLPLNQDFRSLKEEGLAYIQEHSSDAWTNLNASDPGVTILDQVCFALTELGYCNDFPIKDILAKRHGKLHFKNQFYLPEDILTTAPVTSVDYIKYLVDGVSGVKNALITSAPHTGSADVDIYQVYLLIDKTITDAGKITDICKAAYYALNTSRNLGEIFWVPMPLMQVPHFITGMIEIENENDLNAILAAIDNAISNYIFPAVVQLGYQQLLQDGFDINEIFNGPLLQNGWVPDAHVGAKKNLLNTIQLTTILKNIAGIKLVSGLSFDNANPPVYEVTSEPNQLLVIDLAKSLAQGLKIYCRGKQVEISLPSTSLLEQGKSRFIDQNIQLGAAVKVQTEVPSGKYRDINNYYSIQNTFPEVFAVGEDAVVDNATAFQIAQSRQLKGYLTLFDQVLANQFSQLANVGKLFSFKNAMTGDPSDEDEFYAVEDKYGQEHPEYPVPYRDFSPTYFYQSLYDVPHIKPLLKDNDIFNFGTGTESAKELEHKSWIEYKRDPYNPYIHGLMEFMEEERDSFERRNAILNHLLARHGESVVMIDTIIDGSLYTGDSIKDRIIFKSLYLQNLAILTYYRQKAYNHFGANKISGKLKKVPLDFEHQILGGYTKDFIFNSRKIDHQEKLDEQDFINYSAIELKLNMLFGLKVLYKDFIADNYENAESKQTLELAYWMIKQRKGAIFIETAMLTQYLEFEMILAEDPQTGPYYQVNEPLNYEQMIAITQAGLSNTQDALNEQLHNGSFTIDNKTYTFSPVQLANAQNKQYKWIAQTDYFFTVRIKEGNEIGSLEDFNVFDNKLEIILPAFVPQINKPAFTNRLNFFLKNTLPVQLDFNCHFVDADTLGKLIPAFTDWHNALIYDDKGHVPDAERSKTAGILAALIDQINTTGND